jgi:cell fate (sporulation/competence/biofilm development) regulator YmcA (YheA/YmcA/DUF963 family)
VNNKNLNLLLEEIKDLEIVKKSKRITEILETNLDLQEKIQKLYKIQRKLVLNNESNIECNEEYNSLKKDILDEYIMIEYSNNIDEINELIEIITNIISFNL